MTEPVLTSSCGLAGASLNKPWSVTLHHAELVFMGSLLTI